MINKVIMINPKTSAIDLDCYVDTNYNGHWTLTEANNPESVKSCAVYIISLENTPSLWKSQYIQEHCLSVMDSEYISLFMAMRSPVYFQGLTFKIKDFFGLSVGGSICTISTVFKYNASVIALASTDPPQLTLLFKSLAVKYHCSIYSHIDNPVQDYNTVPTRFHISVYENLQTYVLTQNDNVLYYGSYVRQGINNNIRLIDI
eukprot:scaffold7667_cov161-Amphora_coffeaeformis.AAC.8